MQHFLPVVATVPRTEFERAVKEHQTERHAGGFTSRSRLVAMLFCQLGRVPSVHEMCCAFGTGAGVVRPAWAAPLAAVCSHHQRAVGWPATDLDSTHLPTLPACQCSGRHLVWENRGMGEPCPVFSVSRPRLLC
ncbi:MAG: DUF4372 domain-containing protein [Bryobacteraceae bacterium]|nr:DUF4372 domain-containing protein [Bryobacteraceae bacterium]